MVQQHKLTKTTAKDRGSPSKGSNTTSSSSSSSSKYQVELSLRVLILSLVISSLLGYHLGQNGWNYYSTIFTRSKTTTTPISATGENNIERNNNHATLANVESTPPDPTEDMHTTTTTTTSSTTSSTQYIHKANDSSYSTNEKCIQAHDGAVRHCLFDQPKYDNEDDEDEDDENQEEKNSGGVVEDDDEEDDDEDDNDEHLPAGQHLLIDIEHVDSAFLNSEERLIQAMIDVVQQSHLTLLSYHCHRLIPNGLTCVGVLLESHISFHTWPDSNAIVLDLFTCGSGKLIPLIPMIQSLFAIPREVDDNDTTNQISMSQPVMDWSHKLRGFRPDDGPNAYLGRDIGNLLSDNDFPKEEIATIETNFQRIDIYDYFDSVKEQIRYQNILKNDSTSTPYEKQNVELYQPTRTVYLDGVMQSTRYGNEAYHEALVQPVMFTHPNPKRVAIIGGGEGATLREVLKHRSVEKVKMIEIDEIMVKFSKENLKDWCDCSDIVGSDVEWCGDDSRAEIYYEDALGWFKNRFHQAEEEENYEEEEYGDDDDYDDDEEEYEEDQFDVIVMDALDPQDDVPFAALLYQDYEFFESLYNALSDDGVMIAQLGVSPYIRDPPESQSYNRRREHFIEILEDIGFESVHVYDESHCGFNAPWSFLLLMKSYSSRKLWYRNSAEIDLSIHEKLLRTHSGKPQLKHLDGASMKSYQVPHKAFEALYCRRDPMPESCTLDGYSSAVEKERKGDVPVSSLEVKLSSIGDKSGRGLFTSVNIEEGSSIAKREHDKKIHFTNNAVEVMQNISLSQLEGAKRIEKVRQYMVGYGWNTQATGGEEFWVDSGFLTFCNHGCNQTYNINDFTEAALAASKEEEGAFNPHYDRHMTSYANKPNVALRDIMAGEELLCDYAPLVEEGHEQYSEFLDKLCANEEVGEIAKWESNE